MRKIIEGKIYNTETAELLGERWNGLSRGDFNNLEEGLYKTPRGRFFLAGHGGAFTRYAQSYADGTTGGGSRIIPCSEQEAREWVENFCDAERYIEIFGTPEEA